CPACVPDRGPGRARDRFPDPARDRFPAGYRLLDGPPPLADYLALRERSGLSPRRPDQAAAALDGGWAAVTVVHLETSAFVRMGPVLGEGGWVSPVLDLAGPPEHQRRGLGDALLAALPARIRARAPPGAYVSLLADPPGRNLYQRHGFTETAPGSVGM